MSTTPPTPSGFDPANYLEPAAPPPLDAAPIEPASDSGLLLKAVLYGFGGAVAGAISYAAFILVTKIELGILAIGVAWLVAKAMTVGSQERGGRPYQVAAIVLTLISVAMGNAMMLWWDITQKSGHYFIPSLKGLLLLARFGFEAPFLELRVSPVNGMLGFFILYIGLRAAWRMTSGEPGAAHHPFSR